MANYNDLKAGIDAFIKTNGRQEVSGAALNAQLKNMITELGAGYQHMGVATPATNPGTPDANVFYLASEAGTYTNFGGIVINEGEVCALVWNGTWTKQVTGAATTAWVNQFGQDINIELSNDAIVLLDTSNPKYVGKYWSAGGVLSNASTYRADIVNLRNIRGKNITLRCGTINGDNQLVLNFNWLKKQDNTYISLSSIATLLPRTKDAMFVVPDDAVELQICWEEATFSTKGVSAYVQLDAGQNFMGEVNSLESYLGFTRRNPAYSLISGFWDIRSTPPVLSTSIPSAHTSPIRILKNETIDFVISNGVGITGIMGALIVVDANGNPVKSVLAGDAVKTNFHWVAEDDCYVSISYSTADTIIKTIVIAGSELIENLPQGGGGDSNPYEGKIWHCFGTSISDTALVGKYPVYLEQMSGMMRVNFGRSGGCIGPSNSGGNYILNAIKNDANIAQAEVVTIEGFVNDWSQAVPIGNLTDTDGSISFMGAINEALTYIQEHSNAQIFVITDNTGTLYEGVDVRRTVVRSLGLTQNDYIKATIDVCNYRNIPVIDAGRKSMISQDTATLYLADQIHHTELGGYQFAKVVWDEMKRFSPRAIVLPS